MKAEIEITQKTFVNDQGEEVPYIAYTLKLGGKEFALFPRKDDKKLLNYMIEQQGLLN